MESDTIESNKNTLKEMILDEQKLVTYVSISKDLFIHVNDSKKLLSAVVKDIRKKQPETDLNVSYIISGLSEDKKARTTVVSETDLENLRSSFQVVFFEHIYSIIKGSSCVDNIAFLSVKKFEDFPLCTGLIKNNSCTKRTLDEIGDLKSSSQKSIEIETKPTAPPVKKVKEEIKKVIKNGIDASKTVAKVHESKSEPVIKTEIPSPKKESSSTKQATENKKNGNKPQQKSIAGFFNKSNSAPSKKVTKEALEHKKEIIVKKEKETIKDPVDVMEVDEEVPLKKEPKEVKKTVAKKESSKEKSKSNSLNQIKKNAKVDKKRKRVLHVSDSDSDDEKNDPFVDDQEPTIDPESDDEIPPTPTVNTVQITSGILNPKKKRKIVDKTYTDEDGYILTKKEEVYESCSDEETVKENIVAPQIQVKLEVSPKNKITPKNSKKKMSPQKGKQATLMNFFKKI